MSVLVTRPEPDASVTGAQFERRGVPAVIAPIMRIEPRGGAPVVAPDAVIALTSANGARAYAATLASPRPAFCVGPITAAAARAAGLQVAAEAEGSVGSLADAIISTRPGSVLHVRGAHAIGDLTGRLAEAGVPATAAVLYEAVTARALPEAAAAAVRQGADLTAFSPRTARLLGRLIGAAGLAGAASALRLAALSEAVAEAFPLPVREVLIPPVPTSSGLVDFLSARCT